MSTALKEFTDRVEESFRHFGENLPGTASDSLGADFLSDPITQSAFAALTAIIRQDDEHFAGYGEEWEDLADYDYDRGLSLAEIAENSGYFDGFTGSTLRELYDFEYSSDPVSVEAQGWGHDNTLTSENGLIVAHLFSHPSYKEHDSWAIIEDKETSEIAVVNFSWV